MNFGPTTISQTCAALRKEPVAKKAPHALRCERPGHEHAASPRSHLESSSPIFEAGRRHSQELAGLPAASSLEPEDAEYQERTQRMIELLRAVLDARPEEEAGSRLFASFKEQSAQFVSKYRRHGESNRLSFTEVYGVITSLMGFQNEFGFGRRPFAEHVKRSAVKRLHLAEQALASEQQPGSVL